jgi:glycosyltransferase involved in cell wall biosynthesis
LFDTVSDRSRTVTKTRAATRACTAGAPPAPARRRRNGLIDLRRPDETAVVVIPETFDDGSYTPCAHIRLLRPLDHPMAGRGLATTVADAGSACRYHADVIVTQRHAVPSIAAADAIVAHAKRTGSTLIYDLDDDLLTIPPDHPEADELSAKVALVAHMIRVASIVRTSTAALAARIAPLARKVQVSRKVRGVPQEVQVVSNALDERIWLPVQRDPADRYGPARILCMGTATHDADFATLLPALTEIHRQFGDQIRFDLIGFVADGAVPDWIRRLAPSPHAARSYPAFVHWLNWAGPWDIGLAPLADSSFNACKSRIKVLDYAALGLACLASDVPAYRGSLADGPGGYLVPNTTPAWCEALSLLVRDPARRRELGEGGERSLRTWGTLAGQAEVWRRAWPMGAE